MTSQWPAQYVGQAQDGEAQTKKKKNEMPQQKEVKIKTRSNISGRSDQCFGSCNASFKGMS